MVIKNDKTLRRVVPPSTQQRTREALRKVLGTTTATGRATRKTATAEIKVKAERNEFFD